MLVYLYTMLSFAPVLIVLERLPRLACDHAVVRLGPEHFWRVFGIRLLAGGRGAWSPARSRRRSVSSARSAVRRRSTVGR